MNPAVLVALLQYGPSVLGIVQKLLADLEQGRTQTTVTAADIGELQRLAGQSAADIFKRAGLTPPPNAGTPNG